MRPSEAGNFSTLPRVLLPVLFGIVIWLFIKDYSLIGSFVQ